MQTLRFGKFMRKVYQRNMDKRIPIRAMLELTYKCNHQCLHCYNPKELRKNELSKQEIFSIIDQLADIGTLQVIFTGGEIFMRPDIMDIIFYARKNGLRVTLLTNGSLITEEIADQLILWGISNFEISLLGATKNTFERITQVPESFEKVISVIRMLRKKSITPQLKACLTNINQEELEKMADFASELGARFSYSPTVIPRLDLGQKPAGLRIGPDEFIDMKRRFMKYYSKHRLNERHKRHKRNKLNKYNEKPGFWEREKIFECMVGHTCTFINPYGEMKLCMTVPEPVLNVKELGIKACWDKMKELVDRFKPPAQWECFTCEYRVWCSWCPGIGYLNTGDIFGCAPYYKELAKARKQRYEQRQREKELSEKEQVAVDRA